MTLKTKANQITLKQCLESIDSKRIEDTQTLLALFEKVTQSKPVIWGKDIIGFDHYNYKYDSGRTGEWPITGFSPRKTKLSIYIMPGFDHPKIAALLDKLGKHSLGKSCLYVTKLENIDLAILEQIIAESVLIMKQTYPKN